MLTVTMLMYIKVDALRIYLDALSVINVSYKWIILFWRMINLWTAETKTHDTNLNDFPWQ